MPGFSYAITGMRLNGMSQASVFGDEAQNATNYPIVRITNLGSGHVFYSRTHDHSSMAVGYSGPTYTHVEVPADMETGGTNMQVVVNGIASPNYLVGIH